jgi:hypothetical protein
MFRLKVTIIFLENCFKFLSIFIRFNDKLEIDFFNLIGDTSIFFASQQNCHLHNIF